MGKKLMNTIFIALMKCHHRLCDKGQQRHFENLSMGIILYTYTHHVPYMLPRKSYAYT